MTRAEEQVLFERQVRALESLAQSLDVIIRTLDHHFPLPTLDKPDLHPAPPENLTRTPLRKLAQWERDAKVEVR